MYPFCARLASFDDLTSGEAIQVVEALVKALTLANVAYLRRNPRTPRLYASGVYYCRDARGAERQWWDIPQVVAHGCADCKALAAWRTAELIVAGYPAEAVVTTRDGNLFHVLVRVGAQLEDPSAQLGMH